MSNIKSITAQLPDGSKIELLPVNVDEFIFLPRITDALKTDLIGVMQKSAEMLPHIAKLINTPVYHHSSKAVGNKYDYFATLYHKGNDVHLFVDKGALNT